ncbi:ion channel [Hyphomonas sp. FCG-A18]|jgi:hypothetical protein|uniref:ion channel n=1 Tax=Hyphomonas sp. FCG-A18 TaxID=3080019 RepID=UPI002B28B79E|nr:ion channel [Hyphomonas sp. FCG-A18]
MLLENLLIAGLLVTITVVMHFMGLVALSWFLQRRWRKHAKRITSIVWQGSSVVITVLGLFALHSLQIWVYAIAYILLDEFQTIEQALYFSTSTFTTVGFGDLVLDERWRMLSAAESANGFLLIGWSTAFLVSLTSRVRAFEADVEGA